MLLDPRGVRFAAGLSAAVLVVVLTSGSAWLALVQAVVFGFAAAVPGSGPYLAVYRSLVAPALPPPGRSEPAAAVRLDALVGLVLVLAAAAGYLLARPVPAAAAAGAALALAVLHAALGRCPGCLIYRVGRRHRAGGWVSRSRRAPGSAPG